MTEGLSRCSFEFDPESWEREHDGECFVDPDEDEEILTENADGDTVWRCPHETVDGEAECLFHLPRDSDAKPDAETVADRFLDIANGEREALDGDGPQPAQFLGATIESLDFDTEQMGDGGPIDLRHAEIESAEWNVGTVKAELLDARGVSVRSEWDCGGVTFGGDAGFVRSEFGDYALFRGAEFDGDAGFQGVKFGGDAQFREVEFCGDARFRKAKFSGKTVFSEAEFCGDARFHKAKFSGRVGFIEAKFIHKGVFSEVRFGGDAGFGRAKFGGMASFPKAEFGGGAEFGWAEFDSTASFEWAEFGGLAWFTKTEFDSTASFREAEFDSAMGFVKAEFGRTASFHDAEFRGEARFIEVEFRQGAIFTIDGWYSISQFQGSATFSDVTADGPLRFVDEYDSQPGQPYTFLGEVDFEGADIPDAEFTGVSFCEAPTFEDADLTRADLSGVSFEEAVFKGANLTRADLSESDVSEAIFNNALLLRASLYGTDITNARLYGARMDGAHISDHTDFGVRDQPGAPDQDSRTRSSVLPLRGPWPDVRYDNRNPEYDRFADSEGGEDSENISDHTRAATVYAEIEQLARTNADSELASRCYLWRKDMQRRRYRSEEGRGNSRQWSQWARSWLAHGFVRYGESPWRVTSIAGLIILVCALLYYSLDLIEYSTSPSQSALLTAVGGTPPDPVITFLDALYFSTLTFSTLGMGTFQPSGALGRFVATFETLSGVVLLALLVFVFGRRATR